LPLFATTNRRRRPAGVSASRLRLARRLFPAGLLRGATALLPDPAAAGAVAAVGGAAEAPEVLVEEATGPEGAWTVVGLCNWGGDEGDVRAVGLDRLGVDVGPGEVVRVFEAWEGRASGGWAGAVCAQVRVEGGVAGGGGMAGAGHVVVTRRSRGGHVAVTRRSRGGHAAVTRRVIACWRLTRAAAYGSRGTLGAAPASSANAPTARGPGPRRLCLSAPSALLCHGARRCLLLSQSSGAATASSQRASVPRCPPMPSPVPV
jgi:hypothetical protein